MRGKDNIAKWREMSAYQMADKYCHYLVTRRERYQSPPCHQSQPPGPHYTLILKSFMCVDPATLKVHLLFNYRHCCRCFNGTDTDDFFYPLYYHIHCLYLGKPPMGHTIISITRAVAGGIIVPKALLWTEMTNAWMTIWCASSSIEIRYPVLWNGY